MAGDTGAYVLSVSDRVDPPCRSELQLAADAAIRGVDLDDVAAHAVCLPAPDVDP